MKFEEIFKEPGLYKADSFGHGVCFEVTKEKTLLVVYYSSASDISPHKQNAIMYADLLTKDYKKVFNRNELFLEKK